VNSFVLYLNLWGASAKLWEKTPADHLFPFEDLLLCQTHFTRTLRRLSKEHPSLQVRQMGDLAYVTSDQLDALLEFSQAVFTEMVSPSSQEPKKIRLWPLRGGIAKCDGKPHGELTEARDVVPSNYSGEPILGKGSVEAAHLEKSGRKGMRLFITKEAVELGLANKALQSKLRPQSTKGLQHFEFNWTVELPETAREELRKISYELIEVESNYFQQLGASYSDLLSWSHSGAAG
jgi:hypothetical protein